MNSSGGAGGTFPSWKASAGVTWGLGGLGAGISTRFLGAFHECGVPFDSDGDGTVDSADFSGAGRCYVDSRFRRAVDAYHAEDLFVSYTAGGNAEGPGAWLRSRGPLHGRRDPPVAGGR